MQQGQQGGVPQGQMQPSEQPVSAPLYEQNLKPKEWDRQKISLSRRREMEFGIQDGTRFY